MTSISPVKTSLKHNISSDIRNNRNNKHNITASAIPYASSQDIMRAAQRDSQDVHQHILLPLAELTRSSVSPTLYRSIRDLLPSLATFLYYSSTTGLSRRTLGEEYCAILPVYLPNRLPDASFSRRILLVLLLASSPKLTKTTISTILTSLRSSCSTSSSQSISSSNQNVNSSQTTTNPTVLSSPNNPSINPESSPSNGFLSKLYPTYLFRTLIRRLISKNKIVTATISAQQIVDKIFSWVDFPLTPLHAAIFLLTGAFYDFSRFIISQRFVPVRPLTKDESQNAYSFLGILALLQILIRLRQSLLENSDSNANGKLFGTNDQDSLLTLQQIVDDPTRDLVYTDDGDDYEDPSQSKPSQNTTTPYYYYDVELLDDRFYSDYDDEDISNDKKLKDDSYDIDNNKNNDTDLSLKQQHLFRSTQDCMLCMSRITFTTSTPCGHIFCWKCIAEWVSKNNDCPLCRQVTDSRDLIRIVAL